MFTAFDRLEKRAYVSLVAGEAISSNFETIRRAFIENVQQYDLTRDPAATIRYRRLKLPAGRAEEISSLLHWGTNGRKVLME